MQHAVGAIGANLRHGIILEAVFQAQVGLGPPANHSNLLSQGYLAMLRRGKHEMPRFSALTTDFRTVCKCRTPGCAGIDMEHYWRCSRNSKYSQSMAMAEHAAAQSKPRRRNRRLVQSCPNITWDGRGVCSFMFEDQERIIPVVLLKGR